MKPENRWLQRAREVGHPLIDNVRVTFLWEGKSAPDLIDDLHGWEDNPQKLKRLVPGLWGITFELPRDAYLEYAFYDPRTQARFPDPLNPRCIDTGVGSCNHYVYMPRANPSPLAVPKRRTARGKVTHHYVETWMLSDQGERDIYLYRPPVKEPVPLLVVYDGVDYLERGKLNIIVDNMIAERRIRPLALALLQNGGEHRSVEYAGSDATIAWLEHVVLPLARKRLNLLDIDEHRGAYGVLGASFGGLMAVYTGLRMPEIFGKILTQSAAFEFEGRDSAVVDLIRYRHARGIKIWMDAGRLDELLPENRRIHVLLKEHGYRVLYHEFTGGHNYTAWRDDLWRGLEMMFGKGSL